MEFGNKCCVKVFLIVCVKAAVCHEMTFSLHELEEICIVSYSFAFLLYGNFPVNNSFNHH